METVAKRDLKAEAISMYSDYEVSKDKVVAALEGADVVYSCYRYESYEGDWCVIYVKDNKWFIDAGGHCSCNGPEFDPRETTPELLTTTNESYYQSQNDIVEAVNRYIILKALTKE